jgi:dihydrofolate reductase
MKQKLNLSTEYTLVRNGNTYRIREETAGVKSWYGPQGLVDTILGRSTFKVWETKWRWLADRHIGILRETENRRRAAQSAIWESVPKP